jgi:general secretion pathway protein G
VKKAFTMIELVFVIVVIGILSSIAIPRFAATRDDAEIAKAIATIGAVKSSVATERQKRAIRGDYTVINALNVGGGVFNRFSADRDGVSDKVLETPVQGCAENGCWSVAGGNYVYTMPDTGDAVQFTLNGGVFECVDQDDPNCIILTK